MRISLVLGSGGARGYAHIGAIQELEARGHEIVSVAGASMGALVGGCYAAGKLGELTETVEKISRRDMITLLRPSLGAPSLLSLDKVMQLLQSIIGEVKIEELPVPFTAVATDLRASREIWFHDGPLSAAIRASIAIPTVFSPVKIKGRLLADGGLVNPLPLETSLKWDADLTVAVSLFGMGNVSEITESRKEVEQANESEDGEESSSDVSPFTWISEQITSITSSAKKNGIFEPLPSDLELLDMLTTSLDIMQGRIQASRVAVNPPDVHVEVPANAGSTFDFFDASRFIELGRKLAIEEFDRVGL